MPPSTIRILLVEDNPGDARLIREMLAEARDGDFQIHWVTSLSQAMDRLAAGGIDLVLLDLGLPDSQGLDTFTRAYQHGSGLPFLVLTGHADEALGVTAVRLGAQDYLFKGEVTTAVLSRAIRYAIERQRAAAAIEAERQKLFTLLNNIPGVVHLKNADFKILFANRQFREVFGDPDDRPCYEFIHGRNTPCEYCTALEVLQTRVPKKAEGPEPVHGHFYEFFNYPLCGREDSRLVLTLGIDITERKRAEAEIKLNEARLASLMRISQYSAASIQDLLDYTLKEAIALTGSKIGYIYFYDDTTQQFTLNTWSKDVMQMCAIASPQTIYHLETTGVWGEAVRQARPILVNDFQAAHPLKKGYPEGHAPLYNYLTIPVISENRIVAVVGVANKGGDYDDADVRQLTLMMDAVWKIVQRRQADQALRQSEARLAEAQRLAHVGSWEWDVKTKQAVWSEELFRMFNLPPGAHGPSYEEFLQYVHPDDRDSLNRLFTEALASGSPLKADYRIILDDGSQLYIQVDAEIILSKSGEPALVRGTLQNITERVMAEQKLRESEERFRQAMDASRDGLWDWDVATGEVYYSPGYFRMLGYEPGELPGKVYTWLELINPRDRQQVLAATEACIQGDLPAFSTEFRLRSRDGTWRWVLGRGKVISRNGAGRALRLVGTHVDITESKETEKKLLESERELRYLANRLLTAQEEERKRISGELHDELGHALLTLKLNLRSIERSLQPDQQVLADEIESLFHYLDEVIENVRRLYLALAPGDIEDLGLTTALQMLINEFAENNPSIQWSVNLSNIDKRFPPQSQTAIYRIFQEILTNIGKHAHPAKVSVKIRESDGKVLFEVEDNGQGFPSTEAHKYPKKGMGLLAMEERVRMLGGSLQVWGQKNQGTRITFAVPDSEGGKVN